MCFLAGACGAASCSFVCGECGYTGIGDCNFLGEIGVGVCGNCGNSICQADCGWGVCTDDKGAEGDACFIDDECCNNNCVANVCSSAASVPPEVSVGSPSANIGISPELVLGWQYHDDNGDCMSKYQVQIWDKSDFSGNKLVDSGEVSTTVSPCEYPSNSVVNYNINFLPVSITGHYYWQIKLWDESGAVSDWIDLGEIQTLRVY